MELFETCWCGEPSVVVRIWWNEDGREDHHCAEHTRENGPGRDDKTAFIQGGSFMDITAYRQDRRDLSNKFYGGH